MSDSTWKPHPRNSWPRPAKRSRTPPISTSGTSTAISLTALRLGGVKRNLGRLIGLGQLRPAMELSLELMVKGSHQIEMSDEGLMTDEMKECLQAVLEALPQCDLPADEVATWCTHMLAGDSVGFVCDEELKSLHRQFEASP